MLVSLEKWASSQFDPAPKLATLRAWAGGGMIHPAPVKIGRRWMVQDSAEYRPSAPAMDACSDRVSKILRMAS